MVWLNEDLDFILIVSVIKFLILLALTPLISIFPIIEFSSTIILKT